MITFLGPYGATFSHEAYDALSKSFNAPKVTENSYRSASSNDEVLKLVIEHGGYGAIAFETLAEGVLVETFDSFINLLRTYKTQQECPFHVIGGIQMELHFCLMAYQEENIEKIIAHPKALGACKNNIDRMGWQTIAASSNGEAARLVAESDECKNYAALGPKTAAEKYGLKILNNAFEDKKAITTFLLVGPKSHPIGQGKNNRTIIIFDIPNTPGSLIKTLTFFEKFNVTKIHSAYAGGGNYSIGLEIESSHSELQEALLKFKRFVQTNLIFGPFPVKY